MELSFDLAGRFKFEIFNKDGSLSYSVEETPNFITSSGLNYVRDFALADCFRYISAGTGTGLNTVLGAGTTGLTLPVSGLQYIGGNPVDCGRGNQYIDGACGYRVDLTGLSLFRGWKLPAGTGIYFNRDYILNEFMVTPGPSRVWGYINGGLSGACSCSQTVYRDVSEVGEVLTGIEARDFNSYYTGICDADKAFARVLRRIPVLSGQFLIAHYSLYVNLRTGITAFGFTGGRLSPYDGQGGVYNWSGISGLYSLLHYGFKPINNGTTQSVSNGTQQINTSYRFRLGESFIPFFGMPLEPSCPTSKRVSYLTTDAVQFFVNPSGGPMVNTGKYFPFNTQGEAFPSGVFYFEPKLISDYSDDNFTNVKYAKYSNSRRNTSTLTRPSTGDFLKTQVFAIEEVLSSEVSGSGVFSLDSSRNRSFSLNYNFNDENGTMFKPVRSCVQAYKHTESTISLFPYMDMLFYPQNTGGKFYVNPIPDANTTSGITFFRLLTPTGINDYPPLSVNIKSPYNSSLPTNDGDTYWEKYPTNSFNSGNVEITSMGYLFTVDDRVNKRTILNLGDTQNEFVGVRSIYEADKVRFFCYVTPIYNSGFISNLIWTGLSFPTEAVELSGIIEDVSFPYNSEQESPHPQATWPSLKTFVARDVTYPSWLLTGQNCVFCSGRFVGNSSGLYLTRTVVEKNHDQQFVAVIGPGGITDNPYTYYVTSNNRYSGIVSASFTPSYLTSYKLPSGAFISGASGGYSYMDWNNRLTMKFYLNWGSPCSSGVIGC